VLPLIPTRRSALISHSQHGIPKTSIIDTRRKIARSLFAENLHLFGVGDQQRTGRMSAAFFMAVSRISERAIS
jgi:hypothetical protein